MEKPVIFINGEKIKANNLKFGAYRQILKLQKNIDESRKNDEEIDDDDYLEYQKKIIALAMDLPLEKVDEMEIADVLPLFRKLLTWVIEEYTRKLQTLPNVETPPVEE